MYTKIIIVCIFILKLSALLSLNEIVVQCKRNDPNAQKQLYEAYKDILFATCKRYLKNEEDAEDVFVEAFFKIFSKINTYKGNGSFEGWMKRITVNECLMFLRKNKNFNLSIEANQLDFGKEESINSDINFNELLEIMDLLPVGYRTVFNMYVIEGYKHREIAKKLGISINTSKSQLLAAKRKFQGLLKKKQIKIG